MTQTNIQTTTPQEDPRLMEIWGDKPNVKLPTSLQVATQNAQGLSGCKEFELLTGSSIETGIDILCIQEPNLDLNQNELIIQLHLSTKHKDPHLTFAYSTPP